jgi:hypothetical protein
MSLTIKNWALKQLLQMARDDELDLKPDYQRREAWSAKKKMVLIDSIARRIPINAITLFKSNVGGAIVYEVIDGKQRLTSLVQYQNDELAPLAEAVKDLSEEEEQEGRELADKIKDKKWSELDRGTKSTFLDYEVPVYVVDGSRASAVRAFRRMNSDPYALVPQEIRNAVFKDSEFLKATRSVIQEIEELKSGSDPLLVEWGVINSTQWDRMRDVQFVSELLCLTIKGPQEARRSLDDSYDEYFRPSPKKASELKKTASDTAKVIRAAHTIMGPSLKPHCMESENDVYCLIGALLKRGIPSGPQLANEDLVKDLRSILSVFRQQVLLCQEAIKENDKAHVERHDKRVQVYASSLLGGQINSARRRETRIDVLVELINDRLSTVDAKKPTEIQRKLVWASSTDKKCARCGKTVENWADYDCGHIDPRAFGGRAVTSNLRVEHSRCNRSAQET